MQRRIVYILVLMTCCITLIIGLQVYWNYSNYKITVSNFKKESNNALVSAVKIQQQKRLEEIANKIRRLMADTSFLTITCNINNRDSNTVFVISDTHPKFKEDTARKVSLYKVGMTTFTQQLRKITPEAKQLFIDHFIKNTLRRDLQEGTIYYYTQGLGDSISAAMINNKFNVNQLSEIYAEELGNKGIYTDVKLAFSGANVAASSFQTKKVNASLLQYGKQNVVYGILENPNQYYLKEMKWILVSSVLLICIVTTCFYYTAKTLLSQQKLALLKNQFVSNMTHEIHTPLASIKITAEALQKYDLDKNSISEYLEIIQNQTDKLIDLTNQLLNKARNEHFELQDFEDLALNHLIRNVINHQAVEDKVKINYNESNFRIKGNNVHLTNVFNNIVDNALKYNRSEIKQVDIDAIKRNHIIEISISDNGIGISAENLKHIFDPFYRVTANETHDVKGYGLGLDYAKTVIEKHGGTIEVRSEINKGSTFIINLPYEG